MDRSILDGKQSFKILTLSFSSKLVGAIALFLLLMLPLNQLEPWFTLWSLILLRLHFISVNLLSSLAYNIYFSCSWFYVHKKLLTWSKKQNCFLHAVLILLKIKFGHTQISVPKTGKQMKKNSLCQTLYFGGSLSELTEFCCTSLFLRVVHFLF